MSNDARMRAGISAFIKKEMKRGSRPEEVVHALLTGLCAMIQAAPDDDYRLQLTDYSMSMLVQHCGLNPDVITQHAMNKAMAAVEAQGSA